MTKEEFLSGAGEDALCVTGIASTTVFEGRLLKVTRETVRLPDGKTANWEMIHHKGAVCVVPVDKEGNVLLVRQFRFPTGKVLLEIPAGKLETREENRDEAVRRELREETGAIAERILSLGDFYTTPAYSEERITMYYADGLTFGERALDEHEFLSVVKMPLEDAVGLVMDGQVEDAKTQAALLRVYLMKKQGLL